MRLSLALSLTSHGCIIIRCYSFDLSPSGATTSTTTTTTTEKKAQPLAHSGNSKKSYPSYSSPRGGIKPS